jgi:hypothetical protein
MKPIVARIAAVCAAFAVPIAACASPLTDARALPWTVAGKPALVKQMPDVAAVNRFIQQVLPKPVDDNPVPVTDAYTFADLHGDGKLELIFTLSDGSRFFSGIAVISKVPGGFAYAKADDGGALDIPDLDEVLISADGGPGKELLLPRWLGVNPGATPGPIVYDIYAYTDRELKKANLRYANYYRTVLFPKLEARIAELRDKPSTLDTATELRRSDDIAARTKSLQAMQAMLDVPQPP